ncbi:MAG: RNA pseudouridine synthase [Clostridia bacterium]|nr:RNA pseudouridine synthase [Clostridia bacterium]
MLGMEDLTVLYEDRDAVAVVKPQGVVSEDADGVCLPALLRDFFAARGENAEIYPVHRLDKPTGGAILYARTKESAARLSLAVADRRIEKRYLAVVVGCPEEAVGRLTDYLYHDKRQNKVFAVKKGRKGAKEAILDYRTVATVELSEGEVLSLLSVTLRTGRTHQIRAQFASRKLPIFGDRRYGARVSLPEGRIALWSHELCFPCASGDSECVVSIPPLDHPWSLFFGEIRKK